MLAKLTTATVMLAVSSVYAGSILIINESSGTSETGTTSSITTQLSTLHTAAGNVVTISDPVPADLSSYDQVWDIRFSSNLAITAAQQAQYLGFLQGGGGMFVMGENSGFTTRNNSVLALIAAAGGGSLSFITPTSTQTVVPPFTGPNPIVDGNVSYAAPGGVTSPGSGQYITTDGVNGTGVAFGVGDLTNAPLGALTVIFDVNFMMTTAEFDSQQLTKNLINFVDDQVDPPGVPEPSSLVLMSAGLLVGGLAARRRAIR